MGQIGGFLAHFHLIPICIQKGNMIPGLLHSVSLFGDPINLSFNANFMSKFPFLKKDS